MPRIFDNINESLLPALQETLGLSPGSHGSKFRCSNPLSKNDAKAFLDRECRKHRGWTRGYIAVREAIQIAQLIPDTHRIRGVPSFKRFVKLVCNNPLADFQECGAVCNDLAHQAQQLGRG